MPLLPSSRRLTTLRSHITTTTTRTMANYTTNTSMYKLNHTMLRVKDPQASIKYYSENFGMKVINRLDVEEAKFSLYFLAFDSAKAESAGKHWTDRESVLELTHNYGTENDPNYKARFGHICFSVDHLEATCAALETAGVKFQKKLTEGKMRDIAFALDPDGYWVELIGRPSANPEAKETDKETYRFNHTMIRVKDPEKSLLFYQSTLGMSLLRTVENKESKFNLYFLGYRRRGEDGSEVTKEKLADREGLLELTWNYGTESDPNFKYHNGNTDPQGFGHLCISVDSLEDACARFEDLQVNWKKRLTDGRMKTVAFILDPDDYWIEILQNEGLKKSGAGW